MIPHARLTTLPPDGHDLANVRSPSDCRGFDFVRPAN